MSNKKLTAADEVNITKQTEIQSYINFVRGDRKSTRLNSSHQIISYAVFCLKKKNCTYPFRSHKLLRVLRRGLANPARNVGPTKVSLGHPCPMCSPSVLGQIGTATGTSRVPT